MARRVKKWRAIGQWLKKGRKGAGLTLSELASRTRVSTSALARFESDRAVPSFDDVCVIAQQLGGPFTLLRDGLRATRRAMPDQHRPVTGVGQRREPSRRTRGKGWRL